MFDLRDAHSSGSPDSAREAAPTCRIVISPNLLSLYTIFIAPLNLNRVAQRRPRAVRFQALNARRGDDAASDGLDQSLLGRPVRRRQARARPVLLDRRASDRNLWESIS